MKTTIKKECVECKREFDAILSDVKRGRGKFCSQSCRSKFHGKRAKVVHDPNLTCALCGEEFYRAPRLQRSRHGFYFCSRSCKDKAQKIGGIKEIMPDHYDNHKSTYRAFALREKENKCERCNYDKIKGILEVHHRDRNRSNNELENLEILCPNCHMEEHHNSNDGRYWNTQCA